MKIGKIENKYMRLDLTETSSISLKVNHFSFKNFMF